MSDLAPSYDPGPSSGTGQDVQGHGREASRQKEEAAGDGRPAPSTTPSPVRQRRADSQDEPRQAAAPQTPAAPAERARPVRVDDPAGDLSHSIEGAPDSADIVAVRLGRTGSTVEVRTTFAAAVPTRQTGSKGMNVASFYDVDDNGVIDYEVWASLADDGWGTGHLDRREERASFGPAAGIEVSVEGDTLVTRFHVDRIGGAEAFRWSSASEWGSYESMAASTSARDYAPDHGPVDYPA